MALEKDVAKEGMALLGNFCDAWELNQDVKRWSNIEIEGFPSAAN
jgi:hypothetical protein